MSLITVARQPSPDQPESLGVDFALEPQGDLQLTASGDLLLSKGVEEVISALFRRLTTPTGGFHRYVRSAEGLIQIGDAPNLLLASISSNMTPELVSEINENLAFLAQLDGRLQILSLAVRPGLPLTFDIQYFVVGETLVREATQRVP